MKILHTLVWSGLIKRPIDVVDLRSETLDLFIKIDILNTGKSIYTTDNNESLEKFIDELDWYYKEKRLYTNICLNLNLNKNLICVNYKEP